MKINPIGTNSYCISKHYNNRFLHNSISFSGKHECMKFGAMVFGCAAALGAAGGIIMSGGTAIIPWAIAYIGLGTGSGALIGHSIDKRTGNFDKNA